MSVPTAQAAAPFDLPRLARLTRKELRESLRDRRTIITLVMMPLLLYPLLSVAFQQFFLSNVKGAARPRATLGFSSDQDAQMVLGWLQPLGVRIVNEGAPREPAEPNATFPVEFTVSQFDDLDAAIARLDCDVAIRFSAKQPESAGQDLAIDLDLLTIRGDALSEQAGRVLQTAIGSAGRRILASRLQALGLSQRPEPIETRLRVIAREGGGAGGGGKVSAASIIPFILILMTVTGAVYPAIDLTAGERERGTLEVLVAAPIPRLSVLLAKYIAVVTVALLTATVNLSAMMITLWAGGLSGLLFGSQGVSIGTLLLIFGLLGLFAAFFSALLLVLTSFARSFKEAQAYLIPLMLVSLAPGVASLTPGLELRGPWLIAPLVNIVMLARDLLEGRGSLPAGMVVVTSTSLYALAALLLASRVFGSESVLYSQSIGWKGLLARPDTPQSAPSQTAAWGTLAALFPLLFIANGAVAQAAGFALTYRLLLGAVCTGLVFGGVPLLVALWNRLDLSNTFGARWPVSLFAFLPAAILGVSLWPFAHELVVFARDWGLVSLGEEQLALARTLVEKIRAIPLPVILLSLALVPALFEELFFRGFLFSAVERLWSPRAVIGATGLAFGLFHVVVTDSLALERLPPSFLMGLVLGWVRWRTHSVWPGVLLHCVHNGLLMSLAVLEPVLKARGWGLEEASHLPGLWLGSAAGAVLVAASLLWLVTRRRPESGS